MGDGMTNNTQNQWEAAGLSLHTYAWSVATAGGRRYAPPEKRGDDLLLPFRRGRVRTRKTRDQQVIELAMWVVGLQQDGTPHPTRTLEQQLHVNWGILLDALDRDDPFELVKHTPDGLVLTAVAETVGGLEPTVAGTYRWEFGVEMVLTDPYWYGSEVSTAVGTIDVAGTAPTDRVTLTMGPGRVTNTRDGNWIEYTGTGTVVVDCRAGTAKNGSTYVNGQIKRNPAFPDWMTLYPGQNVLTGAGTIAFDPAYR